MVHESKRERRTNADEPSSVNEDPTRDARELRESLIPDSTPGLREGLTASERLRGDGNSLDTPVSAVRVEDVDLKRARVR